MSILQKRVIDAGGAKPYTNAAPSTANGEVVVHEQLTAAIESIAWKDNVRAASVVNVTLASPGASVDGVTMAANDRVLLKNQTSQPENGIYIWNGAAVAMTRALDASTSDELESAITTVDEGTNLGTSWRQTQVNFTLNSGNVIWTSFGAAVAAASETTSGIAELATQAETDAGTDDLRIVTPLKLATYSGRAKRFAQTIGDASATSIAVTHNLGTTDVTASLREASGAFREVMAEVQHTSTNVTTFLFDAAPALNSLRATIIA